MTFKPGDWVRSTEEAYILLDIPEGTAGLVMHVLPWDIYTVLFQGDDFPLVMESWELEPYRSRFRMWLDRWFPARDAERDLGSEETVEAFKAVQEESRNGNSDSDRNEVR